MMSNTTTSEHVRLPAPVKAVVFDLDDTLYPESQYVLSGLRAMARFIRTVSGVDLYDDLVALYMAGERSDLIGKTVQRRFKTADPRLLANAMHVFWAHRPHLALFPDAQALLSMLYQRRIRTALITVGNAAVQRRKVEALGLDPLLDSITHTDELLGQPAPGQTCPDAFLIIALELGVDLHELAYVGDNPATDFLVPNRLGIRTTRILRRHGEHVADQPPSPEAAPQTTLDALTDFIPLLQADATPASHPGAGP